VLEVRDLVQITWVRFRVRSWRRVRFKVEVLLRVEVGGRVRSKSASKVQVCKRGQKSAGERFSITEESKERAPLKVFLEVGGAAGWEWDFSVTKDSTEVRVGLEQRLNFVVG
jgi:hypothetical protein